MPSYILPIPDYLRGHLLRYNRLYAYPHLAEPPPPDGLLVLDSGAFALSKSKKKVRMDLGYMQALDAFYEYHLSKYPNRQIVCIAPDVRQRPDRTMKNWTLWHTYCQSPVAPVLQARHPGIWDWEHLKKQMRFYQPFTPESVCLSNSCYAASVNVDQLKAFASVIRNELGTIHLHKFGAGWDAADIRGWAAMQIFDSIDSIAYHTSKTRFEDGATHLDPTARGIANAIFANEIMGFTPPETENLKKGNQHEN